MSFKIHTPKRRSRFESNTVTVARHKQGAIHVCWSASLTPNISLGDRVNLMIGEGDDAGRCALERTLSTGGYKVHGHGDSKEIYSIRFTPPTTIKSAVSSLDAPYHVMKGMLVFSVPKEARDSLEVFKHEDAA